MISFRVAPGATKCDVEGVEVQRALSMNTPWIVREIHSEAMIGWCEFLSSIGYEV